MLAMRSLNLAFNPGHISQRESDLFIASMIRD